MKIEITKKAELNTSKWSGGTTTQLAIFPQDASYQKGDFQFRLSTAKVEAQTSNFTKLPGISRVIMILEGKLELTHKNRYTKSLQQFDTDNFEGDWETCSIGQVTDFNLMTTSGTHGELDHAILIKEKEETIILTDSFDTYAIYAFSGAFELNNENQSDLLEEGDIVLMQNAGTKTSLNLKALTNCEIIIARINTNCK
ncbi:MAG: HutD family protein [Marinifilaceae bacterium]|jgi:environmental stress-induced protein Ves